MAWYKLQNKLLYIHFGSDLGRNMAKKMPLLADGTIVGDYNPLMKYLEKLRNTKPGEYSRNLPCKEDFEFVRDFVSRKGKARLDELIDLLALRVYERVDGEVAVQAYLETYNVRLEPEDAKERIAKIMAGWIVEASKNLGYIKTKQHQH